MKTVRFLASAFLEAANIQPDFKTMSGLYHAINDENFSPTLVKENIGPFLQDRICLKSSDDKQNLVIGSQRFDFYYLADAISLEEGIDFQDFCKLASEKISISLDFFERKASRLALVRETAMRNLPISKMDEIRDKIMIFPQPFLESKPFEWDWRIASRIKKNFQDVDQEFNFIITLGRRLNLNITIDRRIEEDDSGQAFLHSRREFSEQFEQVKFNFDINTFAENSSPRYNGNDFKEFLENAEIWHEELKGSISKFLEIEG